MMAPNTPLAPHFTAHELGADNPDIPGWALSNLYQTAEWLEAARSLLGVPLVLESGWRSAEHNAAVGGSDTSDHPNGLAADFKARGLSLYAAYRKLRDNPLPPFDQLIFYPLDGHIHVGLGPRLRREFRLKLAEGGYPILTPSLESRLRASTSTLLVLVVVGLLIYVLTRKGA